MAFKLKSGNSPKFKMVGSSPIKATGSGLDTPEADAIRQRSQNYKDRLQEQRDMVKYAPWNVQEPGEVESGEGDDPTTSTDESKMKMEEGWDYSTGGGEDANINKYKSKTQIKYENKIRKQRSKQDLDYTDEEKHQDKLANLEDKQRRAKGTGSYGLKFDWRNMLAGDSIGAGFSVEKREDLLGGKIQKHKDKYRRKEEIEVFKAVYKGKKKENKAYKKWKKDNPGEGKTFDFWKNKVLKGKNTGRR
jgi:hypothetical protein